MWVDRRVRGVHGESIGVTVAVSVDEFSRRPVWLLIGTGLAGRPVVVAPAVGSSLLGDDIIIGVERDAVMSAPTLDTLVVLDPADERALRAHYARCTCDGAPFRGRVVNRAGGDAKAAAAALAAASAI
jgi:hypothetical protein